MVDKDDNVLYISVVVGKDIEPGEFDEVLLALVPPKMSEKQIVIIQAVNSLMAYNNHGAA